MVGSYKYQKQYAKDNPQKVKEWRENYHNSESYKNYLNKSANERRYRYAIDPKFRERVKQQDMRRRRRLKNRVLIHYSKVGYPCCVDCGEYDIRCLSIDHINGGGTQHRKDTGAGIKFYHWLERNNYPSGYDTTCMNCNFRRRYNYP